MGYIDKKGFHRKRLEAYLTELREGYRDIFGENVILDSDSPDGQLIGMFAEQFSDLEQLAEYVYNMFEPQYTNGVSQERLVQISGLTKLKGSYSTGIVLCTGIARTVIPKGSKIKTVDTEQEFLTDESVTIGENKSVHVGVTAVNIGAIKAKKGTLKVIVTPVSGWEKVINENDITPGRNIETEDELRLRWAKCKSRMGNNMSDSLYSQLLNIDEIKACRVFENFTNETDEHGQKPHSSRAIVLGGDEKIIAEIVWENTVGDTVGKNKEIVKDSQGFEHIILFDRPGEINTYVLVKIVILDNYAAGTEKHIKESILKYAEKNQSIGDSVIASKYYCPASQEKGYYVSEILVDTKPNPAKKKVVVKRDEIAMFSEDRIIIQEVPDEQKRML